MMAKAASLAYRMPRQVSFKFNVQICAPGLYAKGMEDDQLHGWLVLNARPAPRAHRTSRHQTST